MAKKYKDIWEQLIQNSRENGECWESTYVSNTHGVPYFTHKRKLTRVSRAAWEYHNGKIPLGMFVCHHCDNPKCFRLSHLFLGTPSDNMKDMVRKGRDNMFGRRRHSTQLYEEAKRMRENGYSYRQIGEKLQIPIAAVSAWLIRREVKRGIYKSVPRKFPFSMIEEIVELRKNGVNRKEICKKLKMSDATLHRFLKKLSCI